MAAEKITITRRIYKETGHCFSENVYKVLFPTTPPTEQDIQILIDNINALRGLGIANTSIKTAIKTDTLFASIILQPRCTAELDSDSLTTLRDFLHEQLKDKKVVAHGQKLFSQSIVSELPPEHWSRVKLTLWGIEGFDILRGVGEWSTRIAGKGDRSVCCAR